MQIGSLSQLCNQVIIAVAKLDGFRRGPFRNYIFDDGAGWASSKSERNEEILCTRLPEMKCIHANWGTACNASL